MRNIINICKLSLRKCGLCVIKGLMSSVRWQLIMSTEIWRKKMSDVMLSASMNSNLLALNNTQKMFNDVQGKLATGKEVNSAMDDPSAFYTAQSLTQRANDLNSLMDSMGQAVQSLKAADQGMTALSSFNDQAKSLANQARDDADKRVTTNVTSGTDVDGTETFAADVAYSVKVTSADGTETTTPVNAATGSTTEALRAGLSGVDGVTATIADGELVVQADKGYTVEITTSDTEEHGIKLKDTTTKDVASDSATQYADQYNAIVDQMNQLAKDSGYKGVNLLQSDDLLVVFNEDRSSTLNISGADMSATGIGLSSVTAEDFADNAKIDAVIAKLDSATETLRSQSAAFGNNLSIVETRSDFTENLVNTLEEGANKLVEADVTKLSANMLQLQTNQSLGMNALSLASQSSQAVLKLF
jgi:flagellin-like hook-associated protein FlgL